MSDNSLYREIEKKKMHIADLQKQQRELKEKTGRYSNIFKRTSLALWEINVSAVQKYLARKRVHDAGDLRRKLWEDKDFLSSLSRLVEIGDVNDFTLDLFEAGSRNEFYEHIQFPPVLVFFSSLLENSGSCSFIAPMETRKNHLRHLFFSVSFPCDADGFLMAGIMDLSGRARFNLDLTDELLALEKRISRTKTYQDILFLLTSSLDTKEILTTLLKEIRKLIPYTSANIKILEDKRFKIIATEGYDDPDLNDYLENLSIRIDNLGAARAYLQSGEIKIISDTSVSDEWSIIPGTEYVRSYFGIPLRSVSGFNGLLCLESDKVGFFNEAHQSDLAFFAHAASIALQSSLLYERATDELEKRKAAENSLRKAVEDKGILLKEIHHRVKNNLALIKSLINLQTSMADRNIDPSVFNELKQRIATITLVHEKIYATQTLKGVELGSYISDMISSLRFSPEVSSSLTFRLHHEDPLILDMDLLIPLALLLNELLIIAVRNCGSDAAGVIDITVASEVTHHVLTVRDNSGLQEDEVPVSNKQEGFSLVESLVSQIGGQVRFFHDKGSVAEVEFDI